MKNVSTPPRERIIQTALQLFYAEGFNAVGMNQICTEAKVNKSTLYHLFPSKVDVVLMALEVYAKDIARRFKRIAKSKIAAEQKLTDVFATPFQANKALKAKLGNVKGCFVGNIALELAGKEERVRIYLAYVFQSWAEAIAPIIQELASTKDVDAITVARSVMAYMQGAVLLSKADNDPHQIEFLAKSAITLIP